MSVRDRTVRIPLSVRANAVVPPDYLGDQRVILVQTKDLIAIDPRHFYHEEGILDVAWCYGLPQDCNGRICLNLQVELLLRTIVVAANKISCLRCASTICRDVHSLV